jgi:hypothetical protein
MCIQFQRVKPLLCTRTTTQINTIQLTETRGIPLFSLCVVVKIVASTLSNYDPAEIILFFYKKKRKKLKSDHKPCLSSNILVC